MSWLFQIENKMVSPNPETLLIHPFNEIWERDTTPEKWTALREFAYIEFMSSHLKSNPYKGYSEEIKKIKIKEDIIKDPNWIPDDIIEEAIKKIEDFQTNGSESYGLYKSALKAKDKLQTFLEEFDLDERTNSGSLIMKPKDVTNALLDTDKVVTSLTALKKKVEEDIFDTVKTRANKIISPFANPNSID